MSGNHFVFKLMMIERIFLNTMVLLFFSQKYMPHCEKVEMFYFSESLTSHIFTLIYHLFLKNELI